MSTMLLRIPETVAGTGAVHLMWQDDISRSKSRRQAIQVTRTSHVQVDIVDEYITGNLLRHQRKPLTFGMAYRPLFIRRMI